MKNGTAIMTVGKLNFLTSLRKCGENVISRIKTKNQLTIPTEYMKQLNLEPNTDVRIEIVGNSIVVTPVVVIDKDFYDEHLAKELEEIRKEYAEDKKNGKIKTFNSAKELIEDLHKSTGGDADV